MNKYGAKKVYTPDGVFDSQKEYRRFRELKLCEIAGKITNLERQVAFELIPKQDGERAVYYIADFVYIENGKKVVEDVKGYVTEVFKLKKKLMLWRYGIKIKIT
jgi:hypothetical protein